jgi:hypothetical protein
MHLNCAGGSYDSQSSTMPHVMPSNAYSNSSKSKQFTTPLLLFGSAAETA